MKQRNATEAFWPQIVFVHSYFTDPYFVSFLLIKSYKQLLKQTLIFLLSYQQIRALVDCWYFKQR